MVPSAELTLRVVCDSDAALLFHWANDPLTRQNSFSSRVITLDEHQRWLTAKLVSETDWLYLLCREAEPVALIRFQGSPPTIELSYQVAPDWRGQGLATKLLEMGIQRLRSRLEGPLSITGLVKPDNIPSLKIFDRLGFERTPRQHQGEPVVVFCKGFS